MNGGALTTTNELNIGRGAGATLPSNGTATITGGNVGANLLFVGRDGGTGLLAVSGAGVVDSNQMFIGDNLGATGVVNVTAGGTYNLHGYSRIGTGAGSTGTLNISGAGSKVFHNELAGDMQVGYQGGTGNVNVTNGAC
jgi:fibronectin-binding autotransporter adhesin